jgi:hypothetical protein
MNSQNPGLKRVLRIILYPFLNHLSIFKTLYFNFHYFPFRDAIRLPVFLYKGVKLKSTKGTIELDFSPIEPGRVQIGKAKYGFQTKHDHTIWEQGGGTVVFGQGVSFGRGTFFSMSENSALKFEKNVAFGGNDKIICKKSIVIGENTKVAWNVHIIDTDYHPTINTVFNTKNCAEKPIMIGSHNWLGFGSTLLKGSVTPNHCIVAANTTVNANYSGAGENIILAFEAGAKVIAKHISFDMSEEGDLVEESNQENIANSMDQELEPEKVHG